VRLQRNFFGIQTSISIFIQLSDTMPLFQRASRRNCQHPKLKLTIPPLPMNYTAPGGSGSLAKRGTPKFSPLVFRENIAFGFHRNALGLRALGVAQASFVYCGAAHTSGSRLRKPRAFFSSVNVPALIAIGYSLFSLMVWAFVLTEEALRRTGFAYAERLLQALDAVKPTTRAGGRKTPEKGA